MKKIICQQCGSVNILNQEPKNKEIIPCELPRDLDWFIPMQKITSETDEPVYVDQQGRPMTRERYIHVHNLDPEIAQEKMKVHIGLYVGN
jgi:hypothetical protein